LIKNFIHRLPQAAEADIEKIVCGAESVTPDTRMIMGESAEVFILKRKKKTIIVIKSCFRLMAIL
jgi:hypothetical protein